MKRLMPNARTRAAINRHAHHAPLLLPLVTAAFAAAPASPSEDGNGKPTRPPLLILWAQQRMDTAFECDLTHFSPDGEPSRDLCIVNRNNEVARLGFGTATGVTGHTEGGVPLYGLESARLVTPEGEWSRYQRSISGELNARDASHARVGLLDVRSIGFVPNSLCQTYSPQGCLENLDELLGCNGVEMSEKTLDDVPCVEARCPDGMKRLVWKFDARSPGVLKRVEDWRADRMVAAVEMEYQRVGATTLPVKVVTFGQNEQVMGVTELAYRNVDSPAIPERLTPAHIGFLVGSPVHVRGDGASRRMLWAGDRLVTQDEYNDLKTRGLVEDDPQVVAWLARAKARGPIDPSKQTLNTVDVYGKPSTEPIIIPRPDAAWRHRITPLLKAPDEADEWSKYVETFIRKFKLDEDQATRCRHFLKEALERRGQYLRSRRGPLERLAVRECKTTGDARLALEELTVILRPVERMFEELKARLEKIPTRKQRADVVGPKPGIESKPEPQDP